MSRRRQRSRLREQNARLPKSLVKASEVLSLPAHESGDKKESQESMYQKWWDNKKVYVPPSAPCLYPELPTGLPGRFFHHLCKILPLRNPSGMPGHNLLMEYLREQLEIRSRITNREWSEDRNNNLVLFGPDDTDMPRGIVAHTDSVDQSRCGDDIMPLTIRGGMIWGDGSRPMGADDKVGVAIGLAIQEFLPDISLIFTSDEEIGGTGAATVAMPEHYLLVECDRRGGHDLVTEISTALTSKEGERAAEKLLPHRSVCMGMFTDVDILAEADDCRHAFNMSCGYHNPHLASEYVVLSQATQALFDAYALLVAFPDGLEAPTRVKRSYTSTSYGTGGWSHYSDLDKNFWDNWEKTSDGTYKYVPKENRVNEEVSEEVNEEQVFEDEETALRELSDYDDTGYDARTAARDIPELAECGICAITIGAHEAMQGVELDSTLIDAFGSLTVDLCPTCAKGIGRCSVCGKPILVDTIDGENPDRGVCIDCCVGKTDC